MKHTKIQWTDRTWNPTRGCSRVSEGCRNCYAERQAARFSDAGQYAYGFVTRTPSGPRWTGRVELVEDKLREPLGWRKPSRVFVNSMSDLFHESLSDEAIDRVFAVMALAPQHTFQVLTKRAERMREYMTHQHRLERWNETGDFREDTPGDCDIDDFPLRNVWLGVSCEDQSTADERIPILLDTPAAMRFVSYEPAIARVDLYSAFTFWRPLVKAREIGEHLHWLIAGGESGPGARPCDVAWIRSIIEQCKSAGVACFVKQLGTEAFHRSALGRHDWLGRVRDRKGGDPSEWPEDLRVREFPQ